MTIAPIGSSATISSGVSSSGFTLLNGDVLSVFGTVSGTVVSSGGSELVYSGGTASKTTVSSGGTETLSGGTAVGTTLDNSGTEYVSLGGTTVSNTVSSGGSEQVFSGIASFTTVSSGGAQDILQAGGVASGTILSNGGQQLVYSGGTANRTLVSGGSEFVFSGGTVTSTIVRNGGQEVVGNGGGAISVTISNGGYQYVSGGGTATRTTVSSGGYERVSNGTASETTVDTGGFQVISSINATATGTILSGGTQSVLFGATVFSTVVSSGGFQYVYSSGTTVSTVVSSGGYEKVSGGTASGTTVEYGGSALVQFLGSAVSATIGSGGFEIVSSGTASFTSVTVGGAIQLANFAYFSGTETVSFTSSTDVLTVSSGGQVYTQTLAGTYTGDTFALSGAGGQTLVTLDAPCYCAGTPILTDSGERPVENLRIGDNVITLSGAARPIRWIGHRRLDIPRHPSPDHIRPVLIQAGAIADGMPRRPLRVSPDHALLIENDLIPARLLLNGASIQQDSQSRTVTYYHVELDTHDILLADGLPAESYLDTGNRGLFENGGVPAILHPDCNNGQQLRAGASCRPFLDKPAEVEPVWRRLAMRSIALGLALPTEPETTADAGVHLDVDGARIDPVQVDAGCHVFLLPRTHGSVRLMSRSVTPSSVRPWVEDRRRLGVMVSRMTLRTGEAVQPVPMDHPGLSAGWWGIDREGGTMRRWTGGDAAIPVLCDGPAVLEIVIAATLDYPADHRAHATAA